MLLQVFPGHRSPSSIPTYSTAPHRTPLRIGDSQMTSAVPQALTNVSTVRNSAIPPHSHQSGPFGVSTLCPETILLVLPSVL